jgi:hypothetical protein
VDLVEPEGLGRQAERCAQAPPVLGDARGVVADVAG